MTPQDAPAGPVPGRSWPFGATAEEDAQHRQALREAAQLASRRERNYDQPWWAVNISILLRYVAELEEALSSAREEGARRPQWNPRRPRLNYGPGACPRCGAPVGDDCIDTALDRRFDDLRRTKWGSRAR
jgi:hypothetical protein